MPGCCELRQPPVERGFLNFVNPWLTKFSDVLVGDPTRGRHARTVPHHGLPVGYKRYETATTP
jgi:hypothetical protein